jgi:FdhD protein
MKTNSPVNWVNLKKWKKGEVENKTDLLAIEEPLQIKLQIGEGEDWQEKPLAVTMRTPGHDFELAIGFLLAENIIQKREDIQLIRYCKRVKEEEKGNVLIVKLDPSVRFDTTVLDRYFLINSSCGVCGKSAIDAIKVIGEVFSKDSPKVPVQVLQNLNKVLSEEQTVFKHTGGIHAAALFDAKGGLVLLREDVGRHNAFDKLVGAALEQGYELMAESLVMLSGRVSFELVQKAICAGIPIIVAIGAPSSLAVSLAEEKGITLIGFLKNEGFNIYSGEERLIY